MKISTAIALGRTMIKAIAGTRNNGFGEGCALGMAEAAIGTTGAPFGASEEAWPWILSRRSPLPCGCTGSVMFGGCNHEPYYGRSLPFVSSIVHLFNYHVMTKKDWTLDQLIDWIASVEPADLEEIVAPVKEIVQEEIPVCP